MSLYLIDQNVNSQDITKLTIYVQHGIMALLSAISEKTGIREELPAYFKGGTEPVEPLMAAPLRWTFKHLKFEVFRKLPIINMN